MARLSRHWLWTIGLVVVLAVQQSGCSHARQRLAKIGARFKKSEATVVTRKPANRLGRKGGEAQEEKPFPTKKKALPLVQSARKSIDVKTLPKRKPLQVVKTEIVERELIPRSKRKISLLDRLDELHADPKQLVDDDSAAEANSLVSPKRIAAKLPNSAPIWSSQDSAADPPAKLRDPFAELSDQIVDGRDPFLEDFHDSTPDSGNIGDDFSRKILAEEAPIRRIFPVVEERRLDEPASRNLIANADLQLDKNVADKLSALCPDASGDVLPLVEALDTADTNKLKRSLHRLGRMKEQAQAALPAIRVLAAHDDPYVRVHSALAMWKIERTADDVVPILDAALSDENTGVRSFAAAILSQLGTEGRPAIPSLKQALQDEDGQVRLHAAEALAHFSDARAMATDTLIECLSDENSHVRWLAIYALADLSPRDEQVVPELAHSLQDSEARIRAAAAFALGEIGPSAHRAVVLLERVRRDADEEVRSNAEEALQRIRSEGE